MDIIIAFAVFIGGVFFCLMRQVPLFLALALGLVCFFLTGLRRGFEAGNLFRMIYNGGKTAFVVIRVLFLIGCLTALWRASGTIAFFVYYGIQFITPRLFIVIAFILPLVLSYILGTSFGVTGTAGVMLMILARSGGVNPVITAGAIMSGAYFGDRCSPASSAAFLTAAVSGVDMRDCLIMSLKTALLPVILSLAVYGFLSAANPIGGIDTGMVSALKNGFDLSWYTALPAVVLIVLPWFRIGSIKAIAASGITALLLAVLFQGQTLPAMFEACFAGYTAPAPLEVLSGGGVLSMLPVMLIVLLSSTYSGIFEGTGMIRPLQEKISGLAGKIGLFPTQVIAAVFTAGVFCNQTVGTILAAQMLEKVYEEKGAPKIELATDISSSIITIAGLMPWSIAATVPLAMMGVGSGALPFSVFLYAVPVTYLATKKIWFRH